MRKDQSDGACEEAPSDFQSNCGGEQRAEDAGADSPRLDPAQRGQAANHSSARALLLHEIIREEGEEALLRTVEALIWSSLAGRSIDGIFVPQRVGPARRAKRHSGTRTDLQRWLLGGIRSRHFG
jgi:hypothetical protein